MGKGNVCPCMFSCLLPIEDKGLDQQKLTCNTGIIVRNLHVAYPDELTN